MAMSLDGRVATRGGDSKWISGERSRALVHRWRAESDAVAVGIGTALADDPLLTAREVGAARQPARVVFDSGARLPLDSELLRSVAEAPVIVVAAPEADRVRVEALRAAGAEVAVVANRDSGERVEAALDELGRRGITSLFLEGGPGLAGAFADSGQIDEVRLFVAPILLGGGRSAVEGEGAATVAAGARALASEAEAVGDDVLIRARLREW